MRPQERGALIGVGRTAEVYAWGDAHVLKLYRPNMPAAWVEHEARVGRSIAAAGIQAPLIGEVVESDGRLGIIYERLDGPSMMDAMGRRPWFLSRYARQLALLHAAMHATVCPALPRQRASLIRTIGNAPRLDDALRERILTALARLPDGDSVCHGDFHPGNVLLTGRGPVIIDWMTATAGNPDADVARTVLMFRIARVTPGPGVAQRVMVALFRRAFLAIYLRAYRAQRPISEQQIADWLPIMAAARLNEHIADEEVRLLSLVETVTHG